MKQECRRLVKKTEIIGNDEGRIVKADKKMTLNEKILKFMPKNEIKYFEKY